MTMEKWGDDPFSWTRHIVKIASFLQADESQAGIKISRRNISNLRYVDDTTLMAESEEKLKILLMRVKEVSKKLAYVDVW